MKESRYTGEVAYYATMMALTTAMEAATYMVKRPNPTTTDLIRLLQRLTTESMPPSVAARCTAPAFRAMMQQYVTECGLCVPSVLQLLKKYENTPS